MNPEIIVDLQNRVTDMEQKLVDALKVVKGMEIDRQLNLRANAKIPPGIFTKIAYDTNGLVINGEQLQSSDIPVLPIDGIDGLRKFLNELTRSIDGCKDNTNNTQPIKAGAIVGTGTKINYDTNGIIVSSADLGVDDIPELPVDHIDGLQEILKSIQTSINPINDKIETTFISSGTFPKITFDSTGHVVSGCKLSVDDIPMEIITKINMIESMIPELASQLSVDYINRLIHDKLDSNKDITPGTYTKIIVDDKGLVIYGDKLTINDLPAINISNIINLATILGNKAEQDDMIRLNDTVSMIVTALSKIGDISVIQNDIKMKAKDSDLKDVSSRVNSMQRLMDELSTKIPNELIMEQLQQIQNELSTVSGKVSVLEQKMGFNQNK